jgi:PGF-pre-PGF domain-containing protein
VVSNFEEDMGIKQIKLWVKEIASGVKITTKKFNTQPAEITVQKTGQVHKYLQITTQNLETKLSKAVITIKVQKNWLLNNDIDKANIAMFKLNEVVGKWNELPTVYKEEDATYYYYDIEVDSFSYFAIGEKAIVEEEEEEEPEARNLLWLWITIGVVVLIVIFGGSVLAKRKR